MKIFSFLSLFNPKLTLIMLVSCFAFGQGRVNVVDNKGTMSKTGVEIITSTSAPTVPTPIKGDLWVDNSNSSGYNKVFKVYDGTNWIEVNNSENIYIKDNTVDKDGDGNNDTNVTLQQFVENTNNLLSVKVYPNTIDANGVSQISQSDLENYDLFYIDCNSSCLLALSDISIQGKVVKIIENSQSDLIRLELSTGTQIQLNTFNVFGYGITDRGPFFETLSFMWDDVGGKWVVFR